MLSQLAHVELLTPAFDATVAFCRDVLGMEVTEERPGQAYLRGWGDLFHHSLKVTAAPHPGLGHMAWRTDGEEELEPLAERLEATGQGLGWSEGDLGHGRAYRFRSPVGHLAEVLWDLDRYEAPAERKSPLRNRPQRFLPRGVAVRRLDHVTLAVPGPTRPVREFFVRELGFRYMEGIRRDEDDFEFFAALSTGPWSHDLGLAASFLEGAPPGRLHHVAFAVETHDDILRAADVLRDHGVFIEAGPAKHAVGENLFLYLREPGGNRIELFAGGYLIPAPDFGPILWKASERPAVAWLGVYPESMNTYATPMPGEGGVS
jgi:catechol 2,3-dioxygenase